MAINVSESFNATMSNLHEMIGFVSSCALSAGVNKYRIKEIELASEEALVNVIKYGYGDKQDGEILINCFSDNDRFHIHITDRGIPFNPLEVPNPDITLDIEDRKIGGLGIFFVKQFMDHIDYKRHQDQNLLSMSVNIQTN